MINLFTQSGAWFRPKAYGYGAGLPTKWQGWVLLSGHVGLLMGIGLGMQHHPLLMFPLLLIAAIAPLPIYSARTEGGWRWRSGDDGNNRDKKPRK